MTPAQQLGITLIQTHLFWEDPKANRKHFESLISEVTDQSDMIILPEMFSTGFSMKASSLAESMDGPTVSWMRQQANQKNQAIIGSLIISEDGHFYNRLIIARPNGSIEHYDKRHLFSFASEDLHYQKGEKRCIIELNGWRICPLICYDLRFPIWSRNMELGANDIAAVYDLLIYVANWPEARRKPWINLLEARAHENQCYVAGVNRIGKDGNEIAYSGDSAVYDPKGRRLDRMEKHRESIETILLDWNALSDFRQKFPVNKDADAVQLFK